MKKNKENFKTMAKEELGKELQVSRENLRALRFKTEGSKSKNVKESSAIKKQIARIMTAINQK